MTPVAAQDKITFRRQVFTDYIRSLDETTGEPPDSASFERLWRALRRLVRSEVERRGLWLSSPSFLGVYGWQTWQSTVGESDALDELAADCYVFIFVQRLRILRAQARRKPHIEGLVVRCVRNFFHDAQRRQDPLGYRVFSLLKTALGRALAVGDLWRVGGGQRIGGDTVIGFERSAEAATADLIDPSEIVRTWNDDLLPDLLTAHGKAKDALVERLRSRLIGLRHEGIEAFRFQDVVTALRTDARARWAAVLEWSPGDVACETGDDEVAQVVRQIQPDTGFEDRERFDQLLACVASRLERLRTRRRTREYLESLWLFLCTFAVEATDPGAAAATGEIAASGDRMPSQRELSRRLGIPRERLNDLFGTLRRLVEMCSSAGGAPANGAFDGDASAPGGPRSSTVGTSQRHAELMRMTAAAWARLADRARSPAAAVDGREGEALAARPGDVFLLGECTVEAIEWVVLERAAGKVFVVPADTVPRVGSRDLTIPVGHPYGPLSLRCGSGQWIDGSLSPDERTGVLAASDVQLALDRRRRAMAETPGSAAERQADEDPELYEWMEVVLEAGAAVAAKRSVLQPVAAPVCPAAGRWRPAVGPLALAATLLLISKLVLLFGWSRERASNLRLVERLADLEQQVGAPLTNLSVAWLLADHRTRDQTTVTMSADALWLVLILRAPATAPDGQGFRGEVQRQENEVAVWSSAGLRDPGTGEITLAVPRGQLASGAYYVLLRHQDRAAPVAVYWLRIEMETQP